MTEAKVMQRSPDDCRKAGRSPYISDFPKPVGRDTKTSCPDTNFLIADNCSSFKHSYPCLLANSPITVRGSLPKAKTIVSRTNTASVRGGDQSVDSHLSLPQGLGEIEHRHLGKLPDPLPASCAI